MPSKQKLNRLTQASSPYLQQHADNPVDWYEWGAAALTKAKEEDKPLLISIGYSACHWCHVMERQSYRDEEVADFMNQYFVAVKVDREERPDIDQIYIEAAQMLNGNAGWPLNAFALPDGRPFWVGTYFPKKNWLSVLEQLNKVYRKERNTVEEQAEALTKGVNQEHLIEVDVAEKTSFASADYQKLWDSWEGKIDKEKGGFESTQKFPIPSGWDFLLQYYCFSKNEEVLKTINTTLKAMAYGGIYDQIGGGFARYSTDENWFAPHFEKMLYDNAQLVSLYAKAYKLTRHPLYKKVIKESLAFVDREMTADHGGFYAALNADSEGEEGRFYVWTTPELEKILNSEEGEVVKSFYNLTSAGNWNDGQNILYRTQSIKDFAREKDRDVERLEKVLHAAKTKLMKVRDKRIRPSTDDKILVSWNALMLKAYIDAYAALGTPKYLETALKNARFIQENRVTKKGELYRNFKPKKASISGFLEDYAFLADAYIALYEVTLDKDWLERAQSFTEYTLQHFQDPEGALLYYVSDQEERLIARKKEFIDNEKPSSNAVMAEVLYKLGIYLDRKEYVEKSKNMLMKVKPLLRKGAPYFGRWASLLERYSGTSYEVAVLGDDAWAKIRELQKHYQPTALYLGGGEEHLPLLNKKLVKGKTLVYVCQNQVCKRPVETVTEALKEMQR